TQSVLDNQEIADSSFLFKISKDEMFADVDMFGQAIKGQVRWPFVSGLPLDLKVKFINWNFIQFLSAYFGRNFFNEYNSSFSGDVNLQSENGDPWKVTGQAKIINFYMQRGDSFFKNTKTAIISFINGIGKIENFNLEGRQNKIQIQSERFSQEDMALDVLTAVDLRLFHFLLPFLDELGGPFNMSAQFSGPYNKPEILGSAKIANGYLKLKGIPHQFEKIESDIVFSQSKILIGSLKSDFAGGKIKGDGQILIAGIRNLPTAVRLNFQNVQLNIPDKFSSQGYGDLLFSGSWFPFTLSGSYFVQSGLITKEMTSDSATGNIKINSYLAQVLKEKSIDPIVLDLQVLVDKGIAIKNALIDGKVNGAVQVKGAPRTPGILGKINFEKKSKVFFKDSAFEVQTSSIQFNNLSEINPDLYIAAQSRVSDYDVNLLIQGPAQSPNIQLSSLPPLGEQDIISLLALGVTSSKLDQNIQSKQQAEQTGYIIGSAIFSAQNPLNKTLKERLGLNLQFSTGFDSTKNISVPKVTLSRRLSEKVNASASRTLGEQSSYEFKLQYAINSNVSAIGIYESRDANEGSSVQAQNKDTQNILGLDLEFKTEFK
ncbi:MAG: translocation/assembly module TamB domain-containing protein, partial [Pseudobdellovibrionaceae bacterium]